MKRFFRITFEIFVDVVRVIGRTIKSNLKNYAILLNTLLPYAMYFIGQNAALKKGKLAIGSELLIPSIVCMVIYLLKSYANKIGKGTTIPVPNKRFTEVDDDGEVSVRNSRIHELILYLADLEDWLERKGLL